MDKIYVYKTTGYVCKETVENTTYIQYDYDKEDKPPPISSRGRPYRVCGDSFLLEIRQTILPSIFQNGLTVAGQIYTLLPEVAEKLDTEPYLDILPDDLMDAIYLNGRPSQGQLENPHTGTVVILGTDRMILDVVLPNLQTAQLDTLLPFNQSQVKHTTSDSIRIVKYGGYIVQTGMGSAYAGEDKLPRLLPNAKNVKIIDKKVVDYALNPNHPDGKHKARVFESALGYNQSNAQHLIDQLQSKVPTAEATLRNTDQYGQRYTVEVPVTGPNGNSAIVLTGWILKPGETTPVMTTLYVK